MEKLSQTQEQLYFDLLGESMFCDPSELPKPDDGLESRLDDPQLQEILLKNYDYIDAFRRDVMLAYNNYFDDNGSEPLVGHLANRGVQFIQRSTFGSNAEAELVPIKGVGFGINLKEGWDDRRAWDLLTLLNATFLYGSDFATKLPATDLTDVVFPGGKRVPRQKIEYRWCTLMSQNYLGSERFVSQAGELSYYLDHAERLWIRVRKDEDGNDVAVISPQAKTT